MPTDETRERVSLIVCGMHEIGQKKLCSTANGRWYTVGAYVIDNLKDEKAGARLRPSYLLLTFALTVH